MGHDDLTAAIPDGHLQDVSREHMGWHVEFAAERHARHRRNELGSGGERQPALPQGSAIARPARRIRKRHQGLRLQHPAGLHQLDRHRIGRPGFDCGA